MKFAHYSTARQIFLFVQLQSDLQPEQCSLDPAEMKLLSTC